MEAAEELHRRLPKLHFLALHFREAWSAGPAGAAIRRWRDKIESLAANMIRESSALGLVRHVHPQLAALSIVGATERLVWAWMQEEIEPSRREIAQQMADLFWRGIATP